MKQDGKFILMTREELKKYMDNLKGSKIFTSIQQHHTSSPSYRDCKEGNEFVLMKSMENYHVKNKGMTEIAQHFSTFPNGLICVGRTLTKDGGGFLYPLNNNSITIENIGNFSIDIMTDEQKKSIIYLNALLCIKFNIIPSTDTLIYHKWVKATDCPGKNYFGGDSKSNAERHLIPLVKESINHILGKDNGMYIKYGDKGESVKYIQTILNSLSFNCGNEDGIFGKNTKAGINQLQKKYSLIESDDLGYPEMIKIMDEYKSIADDIKNKHQIALDKLENIKGIVDK